MPASVTFGTKRIEIPDLDHRLIAEWHGPPGLSPTEIHRAFQESLESPLQFPPLRQAMVPGDRIALAVDPQTPELEKLFEVLAETLVAAGVEPADVTVVWPADPAANGFCRLPAGWTSLIHPPDDRNSLAYLATTSGERRVYLNRTVVDADLLLAIGEIRADADFGVRGPWSVLFPSLSDAETQLAIRRESGNSSSPGKLQSEASEVAWLVGNQFQIGVVPGVRGGSAVISGLSNAVLETALRQIQHLWTFRVDHKADLVIAGVGRRDRASTLDDLAAALLASVRLVHRGGKIVLLSQVEGLPGPALQSLAGLDDPRRGKMHLKEMESAPDHATAMRIVESLLWADVYLLSRLPEQLVDDLGIIPLARAEEAVRLARSSHSLSLMSHSELTLTEFQEDGE